MAEPRALSRRSAGFILLVGLAAGAVIRAWLLPLPGTPDVGSWKTWSFFGATGATRMYGVGGNPPERQVMRWRGIESTTEYPPLALYEISAVGRVYSSLDPSYEDTRTLTVLIKSPGLLAEILLVVGLLTVGPRILGRESARWIALAFWLNPAVILNGSALGYLDAQMAVPAMAAFIAAGLGRPGLAGALIMTAILTKAQAVFVAPAVLLAVALHERKRVRQAIRSVAIGGAAVAAAVVLPFVVRGAAPNMMQAAGRLAAHDMLSGFAMNVWWIVTWMVRAAYAVELSWAAALTMPVRILGRRRFMEIGYPDPKLIGAIVVIAALAWVLWRARHVRLLADWALVGGWCVYAYFLFSAQVHENHLYLAVPLLALAAGLDRRYASLFWLASVMTALNMYLFYGLGEGYPSLISRRLTRVDLSVVLSFVNVGIFVWLTAQVRDTTEAAREKAEFETSRPTP